MLTGTTFRLGIASNGDDIATELCRLFMDARQTAMPWLPQRHDFESTRAYLADLPNQQTVVLARSGNDDIAGFAGYDQEWIHHLYIAPRYWRQGLGSQLLGHILRTQHQTSLWCFADNLAARAFYERHGFVPVEFTNGADNEEGCPDVLYRHPGDPRRD